MAVFVVELAVSTRRVRFGRLRCVKSDVVVSHRYVNPDPCLSVCSCVFRETLSTCADPSGCRLIAVVS